MSTDTTVVASQEGTPQTPNTPQAGIPPVTETPQAGETTTLTLDQALAELARTRKEAAAHRVKLNAFEEQARLAAEAQMTEAQKAHAKAADLEKQLSEQTKAHREALVRYEVQLNAAKLGIIDPEAALKLMDWDSIEYDANGAPKNAQKLLTDLAKSKPYLVGSPQVGSVANPPRANSQNNTFTSTQIAAMSPEEYAKNRTAIFQAQKEGRITG